MEKITTPAVGKTEAKILLDTYQQVYHKRYGFLGMCPASSSQIESNRYLHLQAFITRIKTRVLKTPDAFAPNTA